MESKATIEKRFSRLRYIAANYGYQVVLQIRHVPSTGGREVPRAHYILRRQFGGVPLFGGSTREVQRWLQEHASAPPIKRRERIIDAEVAIIKQRKLEKSIARAKRYEEIRQEAYARLKEKKLQQQNKNGVQPEETVVLST